MEVCFDKDDIRLLYKIVNFDEIFEFVKLLINNVELKDFLKLFRI